MDKTIPLALAAAAVLFASPAAAMAVAYESGATIDGATSAAVAADAAARSVAALDDDRAAASSSLDAEAVVGAAASVTLPDLPSPDLRVRVDTPLAQLGVEVEGQGGADEVPIERTATQSTRARAGSADAGTEALAAAAPAAVATVGVAALLHSFGLFRWLTVAGVALYSRLTKSDLLDNEHREHVYRLVRERPGMALTELMEQAGLGWGTTVYHLDRLERAGFVTSERAGLHRCYFPVGTVSRDARRGLGALKSDTTRTIAQALLARPGMTQGELCSQLGLSASAASKQITKLEGAGLVRRERDWKTVHLYPDETLPVLLQGEAPEPAAAPALATASA